MNPEVYSTLVPKSGIAQVLTGFIPIGGQIEPYSIAGARLA
jgi:hypothetical protein